MPFGKLYTYEGNARSIAILAVAKANNVDLEIVHTEPAKGVSNDYLRINHLGRVPSFVGEDGYELTESIAIAIYITSQNEKTSLLGKTKQDYASIVRWMSFANQEILEPLAKWFRPLINRDPYNKKNVEDAQKVALKAIGVLEQYLLVNTFLVGERITLADLFAAGVFSRGFQFVFDKEWRSEYPNVTRWYETVYHQPIYSAVVGELKFIDEAVKYQPPKKEQAPKKEKKEQPKAAPKPKEKEVEEDEEEEKVEEPKSKHPLDGLPKPSMPLDEWKRQFSNCGSKYREVAMPWFWEHYNPEEYSLWRLDYPLNHELKMLFQSNNLIRGLHDRFEASRKYIFGVTNVYGEDNANRLEGAYIMRGQEAEPVINVNVMAESFTFTKLDVSKPEDKKFVEDKWSQDAGTKDDDGKEIPYYDGKICL